jgi:hypothetical protein
MAQTACVILDGTVIGRCTQRHGREEFICFLNAVERQVPAGKLIEAVVDDYAPHKHPKVLVWLERYPRWTFHFILTSGSWLNAVETFFSALTRKRASIAAASTQSSTCKPPSSATSPSTMPNQTRSSGQRRPLLSWPSLDRLPVPSV